DHVAIDVGVACWRCLENVCGEALDAAVNAQREAVPRVPDRLQNLGQLAGMEARDVENRAELLCAQLIESPQLKQVWREEVTVRVCRLEPAGVQKRRLLLHLLRMGREASLRSFGNDRSHIRSHVGRIADTQAAHGPYQHLQNPVSDILLEIKHAQRRTSLT